MKTKAVFFDMYETLVTHYRSTLYFGAEMARDAGIPAGDFFRLWRDPSVDHARTTGEMTLEELLKRIFAENGREDSALLDQLAAKRTAVKEECFDHLHSDIIPLLETLRRKDIRTVLVSNCYCEEAKVIRQSALFPLFDSVYLSCEQGIAKPDREIFLRGVREFSLHPEECVYVGDGGSFELETAAQLGMRAVQAMWYLQEWSTDPEKRKKDFPAAKAPLEILSYL